MNEFVNAPKPNTDLATAVMSRHGLFLKLRGSPELSSYSKPTANQMFYTYNSPLPYDWTQLGAAAARIHGADPNTLAWKRSLRAARRRRSKQTTRRPCIYGVENKVLLVTNFNGSQVREQIGWFYKTSSR